MPVILFAYLTGMRRGEILSATWDNYDAVGRTLLLTDTKNGTERLVPITRTASKIIDNLPRGTDRIFNIVEANFSTTWTRIVNAAGEQGLHFHDFRHEAISHFFDQGLSTAQVREISGHKTLSQLSRYTHLDAKKIASQIGEM